MIKKTVLITAFILVSLGFNNKVEPANNNISTEIPKDIAEIMNPTLSLEEEINVLYETFSTKNESMPSLVSFQNGMLGYYSLLEEGKITNEILTIVDFSIPSTEKRMWIMDMATNKVLFHTYVAHGKNTGGKMATEFSNTVNSLKSSLGFFVTAETYYGKNGLSLFIDGMEEGFNSNARERYVVIHGSDYTTTEFIERSGRLGRSYGCPAVPRKLTQDIIDTIKEGSCLFISYPSENYLENSKFLNPEMV